MGKNAIMICPKKKGIMFMEMTMEKFVAYLKQLGFVYQGSEIYGGLPKFLGSLRLLNRFPHC